MNRIDDVHKTDRRIEGKFSDYLNTEMTIMGILSTFCILVVGGLITVLSNISKDQLEWFRGFWLEQRGFLFSGAGMVLASAFLFYRQRSILSYYVGQIYLSSYDEDLADGSVRELYERANSWTTWRFYRQAFICLFSAAVFFGRICLAELFKSNAYVLAAVNRSRRWELILPMVLCLVLCLFVTIAFAAFPNDDHPYRSSFRKPAKFFRGAKFLMQGGLE